MNTNTPAGLRRLVGLCGDRQQQHGLAFLLTYEAPGRDYTEVPTRDRARDLVRALHVDLGGVRLDDLLDNEDWTAILANDAPEAALADQKVEAAHAALLAAMQPGQLDREVCEQVENLLGSGRDVLVTCIDTVELAEAIHRLGGVVVRLDSSNALHGTPIEAFVAGPIDLAIPMTGPACLSVTEAMQAIEHLLVDRAAAADTPAA